MKSTDGGESWDLKNSGIEQGLFGVIASSNGRTLWAVGNAGTILKSTDGGDTWAQKSSGTDQYLEGITGTSDGRTRSSFDSSASAVRV